jgi:hypothetical protein
MKKLVAALALTTLLASPAFAHSWHHHHHSSLLGWRSYQHRPLPPGPAGTTWHDWSRWGTPPVRTGAIALAQDGQHYVRVDSYDVVLDGRIVGRDPDPNIRFQLLREAGRPAP